IARASDGDGVAAFSATFRWDAVLLAVTSTSPPSGGVFTLPTPFNYDVNFNEAIDPSSAEGSVLSLSSGTATFLSVSPDNKTAHYQINGVTTEGALTVSLAAG